MDNSTPLEMYKSLRASGLGQGDACRKLMKTGVKFQDTVDLCWIAETGAPAPKWQHEDGTPTQALLDWHKGQELADVGGE